MKTNLPVLFLCGMICGMFTMHAIETSKYLYFISTAVWMTSAFFIGLSILRDHRRIVAEEKEKALDDIYFKKRYPIRFS